MRYEIKPYSYLQAKQLKVIIKPSINPKKKIDVFDINNKYLCSIGANGYKDYPTYLLENNKSYADERRRLYKLRHYKNRQKINSSGYYSDNILW